MLNYFICIIPKNRLSINLNIRYKFNTRSVFIHHESEFIDGIGILTVYDYLSFNDLRYTNIIGPSFIQVIRSMVNKKRGFFYDLVKRKGYCNKRNHIQHDMFFIGL